MRTFESIEELRALCTVTDRGCWEWNGPRDEGGYGIHGGGRVHRTAYALAYSPIPPGMLACHRCDNPPCCNPVHIFIGTHQDNRIDSARKRTRPALGNPYPVRYSPDVENAFREVSRKTGLSVSQIQRIIARYVLPRVLSGELPVNDLMT